jgi:HEAT repeat protein
MFERTIANLSHANPEIRYEAARKLGDARDERAVQPLIGALPDDNAKVQYAAFSALIKIGSTDAAAPLVNTLLARPGCRVWDLIKLNVGLRLRTGLLDLITPGDERMAEQLSAALESQSLDEPQRAFVVRLLGRTADTRLVEPLIDLLIGGSHMMQGAAAEALGWIGDPRAVSPLLLFLSEGEPSDALRELAAEALGRINDPRAVEPLIAALDDSNEWVRRAAAESLGSLGDRSAIEPLSGLLQDEIVMVQDAAFEALKKLSYGSYTTEL